MKCEKNNSNSKSNTNSSLAPPPAKNKNKNEETFIVLENCEVMFKNSTKMHRSFEFHWVINIHTIRNKIIVFFSPLNINANKLIRL